MSSFVNKPLAKHVTFDDENMAVELTDGRKLLIPLPYFPRLLSATATDRADYVISGGGAAIHWDALDEDIRVDNLLLGIFDSDGRVPRTA